MSRFNTTDRPKDNTNPKVEDEMMQLVMEYSYSSTIVSYLFSFAVMLLLWEEIPRHWLWAWFAGMTLIFLARLGTVVLYKQQPDLPNASNRITRYATATTANGLGWGTGILMLFHSGSEIYQLLSMLMLAGIATVAALVLAPMIGLFYLYISLLVTPVLTYLLVQNEEVFGFLSLGVILFTGALLIIARKVYATMGSFLRCQISNEKIIHFLSEARLESEDLNESLLLETEHHRKTARQLMKAKDEAETANRVKSEFLANMSHEIRTPMNGILGALELLNQSNLQAQEQRLVSAAHQSAEALLELLNDVLDFSKIEAGKLELESLPIDLRQIADQILSLLALRAKEKGLELNSEIEETLPQWLLGDSVRIRQILTNLLSNAIKFTESGKVKLKIRALSRQHTQLRLRIEVIDTGIGINTAASKKLFSKFTQADGSTSRKFGGTGLGLAIVRRLVRLMDGELGVESEPGKGSCFWLEIPTEITKAPEHATPNESQSSHNQAPQKLQGLVLIVEDNPVNQMITGAMLEKMGLEYTVANNGEEALELFTKQRFDIVLMDCQMPGIDGFEATRRIREIERSNSLAATPVIALTANTLEGDHSECLLAGMDDYVPKPVVFQHLQTKLCTWLETRKG